MGNVWTCRAREKGAAFPTFAGPSAGVELLNWQVTGTVVLQGSASLVSAWVTAHDDTKPQAPLPGIYPVDAETLFSVNARGQQVASAVDLVRSLPALPPATGQLTEQAACQARVEQQRVFVLSDLDSFQVAKLLLGLFGLRSRPTDPLRFH